MKNGKVLSLINMKGGVGKTTLTVGIADHLSVEYEKSILVIDADPQFNATQALLTTYKNKNKFEVIDDTSASIKKIMIMNMGMKMKKMKLSIKRKY